MKNSTQKFIEFAFVCFAAIIFSSANTQISLAQETLPLRLEAAHLPNAIRIHNRVISGGQPDGESAFRELQSLGVKTIISVDGAKPDLVLASKYGMRYVNLPHGYNGISDERAAELAKAVRDFEGPIYIHCHHGKHRSPTATVVACVANGMLEPKGAIEFLKFAGTSENYQGLYRSAANARRMDDQKLDKVKSSFPEVAKLPPLAESMVELDQTFDHLRRFSAADWKSLDSHPDLDPAHEALLILEHFKELRRLESVAKEPESFRVMLDQSETDARTLEALLRKRLTNSGVTSTEINEPFKRLLNNCTDCHRQFRDVPLAHCSGEFKVD